MTGTTTTALSNDGGRAGTGIDALFAEVYSRLKAMASRQRLRIDADGTLNTTALVHELYLKLATGTTTRFAEPVQFFDYAAQAMRHILVDEARQHLRLKRGGDAVRVELNTSMNEHADTTAERTLELDDALRRLAKEMPRAAHLVELHYFAGLSLPQIAGLLNLTTRTLNRDWRFARAWLHDMLGEPN